MKASHQDLLLTGGITATMLAAIMLAPRSSKAAKRKKVSRGTTSPEQIREITAPVESLLAQPGLGNFFAASAWVETGGTFELGARGKIGELGCLQMRPKTARVTEIGQLPSVLYELPWSIALGTWLVARLRKYAAAGQVIDWLALRRGWAKPSLVRDVDEEQPRSPQVRSRFALGLEKTGTDPSFMGEPAFPSGYVWPGLSPVLEAVGLGGLA